MIQVKRFFDIIIERELIYISLNAFDFNFDEVEEIEEIEDIIDVSENVLKSKELFIVNGKIVRSN